MRRIGLQHGIDYSNLAFRLAVGMDRLRNRVKFWNSCDVLHALQPILYEMGSVIRYESPLDYVLEDTVLTEGHQDHIRI